LEEELDNLRAAMEWSFGGQIEVGMKIAADLMCFGTSVVTSMKARIGSTNCAPPRSKIGKPGRQKGSARFSAPGRCGFFQYHASYSSILSNEDQYAILHESINLLRKAGHQLAASWGYRYILFI